MDRLLLNSWTGPFRFYRCLLELRLWSGCWLGGGDRFAPWKAQSLAIASFGWFDAAEYLATDGRSGFSPAKGCGLSALAHAAR
jgi:hypothetical protein